MDMFSDSSISNTLFLVVVGAFLVTTAFVSAIWLVSVNEKAEALEGVVLAVIRFGGEYGVMLSKAKVEGFIPRDRQSNDDEMICRHLEEVGLLSEFPASWVLSELGDAALKTIDFKLVRMSANRVHEG